MIGWVAMDGMDGWFDGVLMDDGIDGWYVNDQMDLDGWMNRWIQHQK